MVARVSSLEYYEHLNSISARLFQFRKMVMLVDRPPHGTGKDGKHCYSVCNTRFEVDTKYVHIKAIGKGAYGVVCSSLNKETSEKVAIKKITDAFDNRIDAIRTLREVKILRQLQHENVVALKDIMMPADGRSFKDVYLVYELMDTDLNQVIKSSQPLSRNQIHCLLFQ